MVMTPVQLKADVLRNPTLHQRSGAKTPLAPSAMRNLEIVNPHLFTNWVVAYDVNSYGQIEKFIGDLQHYAADLKMKFTEPHWIELRAGKGNFSE